MTKLALANMDSTWTGTCWYSKDISDPDDDQRYDECTLVRIPCRGFLDRRPAGCPLVEVKDDKEKI